MEQIIGYIDRMGYLRCAACPTPTNDPLPIFADGGWDETCDCCGARVVSDNQMTEA